jgi:hypothetical protein
MNNASLGTAWVESILDGGQRADCSTGVELPACQP